MNKDKKKNYYKNNNHYYSKKKLNNNKVDVPKKRLSYDELVNGDDSLEETRDELSYSNSNTLLYIKYIGTIIILILIIIASVIFIRLS